MSAQQPIVVANGGSDATTSQGMDHANGAKAPVPRKPYDYGGNPLARLPTGETVLLPAFGGDFQPGLYRQSDNSKKFANPAPLGLSAFALTTFVLSLINMSTRGLTAPNIVVGAAFAYGGLVQLLAGMWEMAIGNTFGATALSSYGGFWIGTAIILTPGGFQIISDLTTESDGTVNEVPFLTSFAFYLFGWFIFTSLLLICTLKSTVAFFLLFFTLDLAFLFLALGYLLHDGTGKDASPHPVFIKTGGGFGILAAFLAWYNALAGIADPTNSFFLIPVAHFPWSAKGRERRAKVDNDAARAEQGEIKQS
ncbi:Acetate permease A [Acrodontium crateriforme]|uniref:Acetate permease A n=1 Tax=Acrodontium crateriforme TaxID=150365 RepID=A0AAQ3LX42_9PEZI|nr:Acetate permease A [Acrodontium crateriforme]